MFDLSAGDAWPMRTRWRAKTSQRHRGPYTYIVMFALVGSQFILTELNQVGFCQPVVIKHVDMDKIKKHKDSLSPDQYQNILDRANEIERMIKDGPPKIGNEYDAAIQSVQDQAKQLSQERKDLLSQNEQNVIQELRRLDSDYEHYGKSLSDSQRKQFLSQASELQSRWSDPAWDSKSVNQAITDSNQMLSDIRKVSSNLVNMASIGPGKSSTFVSVKPKRATFIGGPLDQDPTPFFRPGFMESDDIVPNNTQSYQNIPFVTPKLTAESINKTLSDLRLHLDGLNKIGILGTFEYESFSKQLNDLIKQTESLTATGTVDDGRSALLQTLQKNTADLRRSIDNAATR